MASNRFSRRYFFQGALLAGAVPAGGFGSTPSLKLLGYKSPNEKLNIASIGAGGKARAISPAASRRISSRCATSIPGKPAAAMFKQYEKSAEVQRLPPDAR